METGSMDILIYKYVYVKLFKAGDPKLFAISTGGGYASVNSSVWFKQMY